MYALDLAIPPSLVRPMYVNRSVLHKLRTILPYYYWTHPSHGSPLADCQE